MLNNDFRLSAKFIILRFISLLQTLRVKIIFAVKTRAVILDRDNFDGMEEEDTSWLAIIWNRVTRVLRTHAFKIDIDHMFNTDHMSNTSTRNSDNNIVQGES